jgi:hypothetical protein
MTEVLIISMQNYKKKKNGKNMHEEWKTTEYKNRLYHTSLGRREV